MEQQPGSSPRGVESIVADLVDGLGGTDGRLRVVDVGGGTGGRAVAVASRGHEVVVVDPSADALATLARRARSAGVSVRGVQAAAEEMVDEVGAGSADLVLCHGLLEIVDDPGPAVAAVRTVLRPGGVASVVVAGMLAAVLARVRAGDLVGALAVLESDGGAGPRRFTADSLGALLRDGGLEVGTIEGIGVATGLLPAEPEGAAGRAALAAFERAATADPALNALGSMLHVRAARP